MSFIGESVLVDFGSYREFAFEVLGGVDVGELDAPGEKQEDYGVSENGWNIIVNEKAQRSTQPHQPKTLIP